MRTALLLLVTLVAFAANSVLCRAALAEGLIGPGAFTALRICSGAVMLMALLRARGGGRPRLSMPAAAALLVYAAGFSYAYLGLASGTGALILFAGVQVTMFAGALLLGERPAPARWIGSALALCGLGVLFLPGAEAPPLGAALMMLVAAAGWGVYSLIGRSSGGDPLAATAGHFVLCMLPAIAIAGLGTWAGEQMPTRTGVGLAMVSGAFASGLGYALWYRVLPHLEASLAAIAQLTVPLIALAGGMVFLSEPLTLRFVIAAVMVLAGVGGAVLLGRRRA